MIQLIAYIYLIMICSFLPMYMRTGYYELGEAKAWCYYFISIAFIIIIPIADFFYHKRKISDYKDIIIGKIKKERELTYTQIFLLATLFSCILSFVFSIDKRTAFFGYEGWRCGLLTMLFILFYCHIYSRFSKLNMYMLYLCLVVPFLEFGHGVLNRMGIYPVEIYASNNSFLATLGNINWYSGFLSIFVPLGMGILYRITLFTYDFWMAFIYTTLGFAAIFMQGSEGAVLIIIAAFVLLIWHSLDDRTLIKRLLIVAMALGVSMSLVDVMFNILRFNYTYESNHLMNICLSHAGFIIFAAAFFLYQMERLFAEIKVPFREKDYKIIYGVLLAIGVIGTGYYFCNIFSDDFGNGRGLIWRVSLDIFKSLSPWQQLVGVGQDCMSSYIQKDGQLTAFVLDSFNGTMLTNAHNDILTVLIERGLIGVVCYIGLFAAILYELLKKKEKEPAAIVCGLPIFSYLVFNLVSFAQITSMPYVYILIGLGVSMTRKYANYFS